MSTNTYRVSVSRRIDYGRSWQSVLRPRRRMQETIARISRNLIETDYVHDILWLRFSNQKWDRSIIFDDQIMILAEKWW